MKNRVGLVVGVLFFAGGLALLISGGLRWHAHHDGHHAIVSATVERGEQSCFSRGCHRTAKVSYTVNGHKETDVSVVDADWDTGDQVKVLVDTDSTRHAIEVGDQGYLRMVIALVLWGFAAAAVFGKDPAPTTP